VLSILHFNLYLVKLKKNGKIYKIYSLIVFLLFILLLHFYPVLSYLSNISQIAFLPKQARRVLIEDFTPDNVKTQGLMTQDHIVRLNESKIEDVDHLISLFTENKGKEVSLEVIRDDQKQNVKIEIPSNYPEEKLGIQFSTDTPFLRHSLPIINPLAPVQSLILYVVKSILLLGIFTGGIFSLHKKSLKNALTAFVILLTIFLLIP
jgi:hypothetical protein